HSLVGESGQGLVALRPQNGGATGRTGRAYAATLFEVAAIARLSRAAQKTYGIAAIVLTHGETDYDNADYEAGLIELCSAYNRDLARLTGQTRPVPIYLSQQHAFPNGRESLGERPRVNQVQWQLAVTRPRDFVCVGPKYQYPGHPDGDGVHLSAIAYQMLGEKVGQAYYEREVQGRDFVPLHPTSVERRPGGRGVAVCFHVPVAPLVWDPTFDPPSIPEWANGRGFELWAGRERFPIRGVDIAGDTVSIVADRDLPARGVMVGYALASQGVQLSRASQAVRWGQLRDSDPFTGSTTGAANPNYCVSFAVPAPDAGV
ncbi:MAG: dockerin, partial [Polyangiaceae bacterium]|nr:dockerin [Polyangiaceae bacterium]